MLVLSAPALSRLQSAIVEATHGLVTIHGARASISTIDPKTLRMAAIMAAQMAAGEMVFPGDETLEIDTPQQQVIGPIRIGARNR